MPFTTSACMFFIDNLVADNHDVVDAFSGWRRNYDIGAAKIEDRTVMEALVPGCTV